VRTKLIVVLVIPALAVVSLAGLLTSFSVRQQVVLGQTAEQVALGAQVTALVHELQFERDWATGHIAGGIDQDASSETVVAVRDSVDAAVDALAASAGPLRDHPELRAQIAAVDAALAELAVVRAGMDAGWLPLTAVSDGYGRAIETLLDLLQPPAEAQDSARGLRELAEVKELRSQVRALLHAVTSSGGFGAGQAGALVDTLAQQRAAIDRFRATADPEQVARFDQTVRGQAVATTGRLEEIVLAQSDAAAVEGADAARWWAASTTELELVREVEVGLLDDVLAQVRRAADAQWRETGLLTGATAAILVVSLLASVGVGSSMARSLRRLHGQAVEVARVRLPELLAQLRQPNGRLPSADHVPRLVAGGRDEVGAVAVAFTEVHRETVNLAVELARMRRNVATIFRHLARRSQVLVERQLELLTETERDEEEPARLRSLFGLDHLATRMRRNNDSLLVLAGAGALRRYEEPVELHLVVMAALAEIEQYQRVRDDVADGLHVVGHVVTDLVHLLAELLDNATAFSDPHTMVRVEGRRWEGGDGAEVAVTDLGMGMTALALRDANRLLERPPPIDDVSTAERMGLVVVGHLAARHGVRVWLEATHTVTPGVRATVFVPERLLTEPADTPRPELLRPTEVPEGPRVQPTRAEDVLGRPRGAGQPRSVWFARQGEQPAEDPASLPAAPGRVELPPPAVPAEPDGVRYTAGGLVVRQPMAQTPPSPGNATRLPHAAAQVVEQDPAEAGRRLAALYGGVRRALAEADSDDTQEITLIRKDDDDKPAGV
jgi:hypothetical protein